MNGNTDQAGKYLFFKLANEEYGIAITRVKEMIGRMVKSRIPQSYDYMKGIIPLQGSVIPLIDLRTPHFSTGMIDPAKCSCIVVVEINRNNCLHSIGLVVDSLSEITVIKDEQINVPLNFKIKLKDHFVTGVVKTNNRVKILLDINKIVNSVKTIELPEADFPTKKWPSTMSSLIKRVSCLVVVA